MLALQFGYAGYHVVSRAALNMGISKLLFPIYRNIIALLLLLPFAYFLEKKGRPAITLKFLVQFFLLASCRLLFDKLSMNKILCNRITANQGFYLLGLDNTSPTFASAIQNSVPAITFLMATILRIEQVRLNRKDGVAKVLGTIFCVAGASVITLYQGPVIYSPSPPLLTSNTSPSYVSRLKEANGKSWALGCLYLICHCLSWSGWLVLQAPILKKYPARLSVTSYTCFFGLIQFMIIALIFERSAQAWIFHSGEEVFTIFYAVASGIAFAVQTWCIDKGGPVFVAVYQPVQTLVVAIVASIALGEEFYLGGIIGAILIIIGLYLVLWGRSEEKKFAKENLLIQSTLEHNNSNNNRNACHSQQDVSYSATPSSIN
ncbi:WAT1-related protein [Quillaja saponaria]|uniref:WAT1-related protein n=1 Tax=Quillaja saponaria TaxID=32244 RepID=A0AAD7LH91_QUISA|nr:WAT1-related protein [Quillaja saponaria]